MNDTPEVTPEVQDATDAVEDAIEDLKDLASEPANNLVERLRDRREALSADRTEVIELPGLDELGMEYRVIDDTRLRKLIGKPSRGRGRALDDDVTKAAGDLLIQSAIQAMVWVDDGWVPAHEVPEVAAVIGDTPARFDAKLVMLLRPGDPEPKTARGALHQIIPLSMAVLDHANEVMEWQQGRNRETADQVAGE